MVEFQPGCDDRVRLAPCDARDIGYTGHEAREVYHNDEDEESEPIPFRIREPGQGMEICLFLILHEGQAEGVGSDVDVLLWNVGDAGSTVGLRDGWHFGLYSFDEMLYCSYRAPMSLYTMKGSMVTREQAEDGLVRLEAEGRRVSRL
jgi:hypothetical protein